MQDSRGDADVQGRLFDSVGEGEGGMIWENGIETCMISYVIRIASSDLVHDTGCSGLVHRDDPGWGTRVHPWQIHVDVWQNQCNIAK